MSLPSVPPPDDPATAPTVQVWRTATAPRQPTAAPLAAVTAASTPPCDAPSMMMTMTVTVTPATAPTIQTWRVTVPTTANLPPSSPPASPPASPPCRPPLAPVEAPDPQPGRFNAVNRQRLAPTIQQVASAYQLEPALLHAVISAESSYNPQAHSPKGARGLMQLMPATAKRFGVSNPYDPTENLHGGARYLRWLLDLFTDLPLALAAYNAGEGAVQRYGNTIPPYQETQTYVRRVLDFYRHYQSKTGL